MKSNKARFGLLTYGILLLAIAFAAANAYGLYRKEYAQNPIVLNNVTAFDAKYIYNFYVGNIPDINGRIYYGSQNASITIVAYADLDSQASRYFMSEIFPNIEKDFIKTGKARYYHKNHITFTDLNGKNGRFEQAASLVCAGKIKKDDYYNIYFDVFKMKNTSEIKKLLLKYNISEYDIENCLKNENLNSLRTDAAEMENFGILGLNPVFYIGIGGKDNIIIQGTPGYAKFKQIFKEQEILLGY